MKVAIEHMQTARIARTAAAAPGIPSNEVSTWMSREFQASLVAVSASAHALDALYGSTVIPQAVRDIWKGKGTKRHGKIREALKQVFDTVLKWCADHPRPNLTDAVARAGANRASIQELATSVTLPAPVL